VRSRPPGRTTGRSDDRTRRILRRMAQHVARLLELRGEADEYRRFIDLSPDAVAVLDLDGNIELANPALSDLLDLSDAGDLVGHAFLELVVPEDRTRVATELARVLFAAAPHHEARHGPAAWPTAARAVLGHRRPPALEPAQPAAGDPRPRRAHPRRGRALPPLGAARPGPAPRPRRAAGQRAGPRPQQPAGDHDQQPRPRRGDGASHRGRRGRRPAAGGGPGAASRGGRPCR
jgi:hypothetical protein